MSDETIGAAPKINRIQQFWSACKEITVYQVVVTLLSMAASLGPAYFVVKPIVAAQAGEVLKNLMKQEGIDPEELKQLPKKVQEGRESQTRIESDLATVKAQQQQLIDILKGKVDDQR